MTLVNPTTSRPSWLPNLRALGVLGAVLLACSAEDGAEAPPPSGSPSRAGAEGEAGPPGPPGEKGDPGVMNATEAIGNQTGPLPVTGSVVTVGGRLVVTVSGTGYRETVGTLGFDVSIAGTSIGSVNGFTNQGLSHKTLPTRTFVVTGIPAGSHGVMITAQDETLTDENDYFNASVVEIR
jgi:hypothetical protein